MELISVIVPVYKVENYLDRCIQSIVDQTYQNLEIILVDDGSPDNCPAMCDKWAEKDSRIRVIHQENAGGAAARNVGLDEATGSLIAFVDSDDYIAPMMYERLHEILYQTGAAIAECAYVLVHGDDVAPSIGDDGLKLYSTQDALFSNLYNTACQQVIWNKLYKRDVINTIRFVEGKTIDDEFFTYRVIGNAPLIAVTSDRLYFYRQQAQSVMHQKYSSKRLDALEACALRYKYVIDNYPALASDARINFWTTCIYHSQMISQYLEREAKQNAEQRFAELSKLRVLYWSDLRKLHGSSRIWFFLSKLSFTSTCRLRNLFRIGQ